MLYNIKSIWHSNCQVHEFVRNIDILSIKENTPQDLPS